MFRSCARYQTELLLSNALCESLILSCADALAAMSSNKRNVVNAWSSRETFMGASAGKIMKAKNGKRKRRACSRARSDWKHEHEHDHEPFRAHFSVFKIVSAAG